MKQEQGIVQFFPKAPNFSFGLKVVFNFKDPLKANFQCVARYPHFLLKELFSSIEPDRPLVPKKKTIMSMTQSNIKNY